MKSGDESALLAAVYSVGPISVAVDARSKAFKVSATKHYSEMFWAQRHIQITLFCAQDNN